MLNEALKYAAMGWPILPVSKEKTPTCAHGSLDATIAVDQIQKWYDKRDDLGIGLATGEKSGVVVIDFDSAKPGCDKTIAEFRKMYNFEDSPVRSITGSGGSHHFYRLPEGKRVANAVRFKGFNGVDIRGNGGYVVLPPSQNGAGPYVWVEGHSPFDQELPLAPEFLWATTSTLKLTYAQTQNLEKGTRNTTLTSIAGRLRASGMGQDELYDELIKQNQELCIPPLETKEVAKIVDSVCRYPPENNKDVISAAADVPIVESSNKEEAPTLRDLLRFSRTDAGRAEAVRFLNRGNLRYCKRDGRFYFWDGSRWRRDTLDQIHGVVIATSKRLQQAAATITDDADRKDALTKARSLENFDKVKSCIALLKSLGDVASDGDDWDSDPFLLGVPNGVVDLRTGELLPEDRNILMTLDTGVKYNPQATCPRWEKFLVEIFGDDPIMIEYIHRAVGYALTGLTTEQAVFLLVGEGSNGKSVFLSTIQHILGEYATIAAFASFEKQLLAGNQSNDLAAFVGKRLVTSSETALDATFNEARLKSLTGGEKISARFLYQESFTFTPMLKLWLGVNHPPTVRDDSYAFWRRIRRINFGKIFQGEEVDPRLGDKLKAEAEGILLWAIRGAVKWFKDGMTTPDKITAAVEAYRGTSDHLATFLSDQTEADEGGSGVAGDEAYARYTSWLKSAGIPVYSRLLRDPFHKSLGKKTPFILDDNGKIRYTNIKLIPFSFSPVVVTVKKV